MAEPLTIVVEIKPTIDQAVRDILISDIGSLWDDYCYENNVPSDIKLHGLNMLEGFAKRLNKEK